MSHSILILLGHPDRDSLCGALAQRYATAAENAGHRVRLIALGDLEFDPVLRHGYRQIQPLETDLQDAAEAIEARKRQVRGQDRVAVRAPTAATSPSPATSAQWSCPAGAAARS